MPSLIAKIEDKLTGSSHKSASSERQQKAPTHDVGTVGGPNLVPETDRPAGGVETSSSTGTTGVTNVDSATGPTTTETYDRRTNAPVVKETVRDEYQHNVQPVIKEETDKTEILHTVQPLKDDQVRDTDVTNKQRADQFEEVGPDEKLARETEEKLRLERERVAAQGGRVHTGDTHTYTENAPAVSHEQRRHVIEEVQPVVERDILRPHQVEERQDVYVHHTKAPELKETRVAPVMDVSEWERSQASKDEVQTFDRDNTSAERTL